VAVQGGAGPKGFNRCPSTASELSQDSERSLPTGKARCRAQVVKKNEVSDRTGSGTRRRGGGSLLDQKVAEEQPEGPSRGRREECVEVDQNPERGGGSVMSTSDGKEGKVSASWNGEREAEGRLRGRRKS